MSLRLIGRLNRPVYYLALNKKSLNLARCYHLTNAINEAIRLKMPALSPTMTEGTIIKWHKKEGDKTSPGDVLFEVQTDKAVIPFETEEEAIVAKILAPENSLNQVGSLVGLLVGPGEDWKNVTIPSDAPSKSASTTDSNTSKSASQASQTAPASDQHHHLSHDLKMGPAARNLINLYRIDPSKLKASGPDGRVLKSDVTSYIEQNNLKVVPVQQAPPEPVVSQPVVTTQKTTSTQSQHDADYEDLEITNIRKVIAKRLLFSKTTIPHSYVSSTCVIDKVVELRKQMIKENKKVSINDFIIKALALSLRLVPELNSNFDEKTEKFVQLSTVDVSVAVATDKGLITPIVKDADKISVLAISERVKNLADKARQGKLQPHEFQGGSFSISNLGMFGISEFSAVINPPQIAILAVGRSELTLNPDDTSKTQTEISFKMSFDERCVSLDRAAKFLNNLNYFLANPSILNEATQEF